MAVLLNLRADFPHFTLKTSNIHAIYQHCVKMARLWLLRKLAASAPRKRCCNFHGVNAERPHLLRRSLKEQDHDPPTFDDVHGTLERLSADGVQHHLHLGTL